jgi:hypothetical protein
MKNVDIVRTPRPIEVEDETSGQIAGLGAIQG